jgi:hypothetical protein
MNEKILNVDKTLAVLKALESLDLEQASKEELQSLIKNLNKHIAIVSPLAEGRVIIRTVSCKYLRNEPIIYPTRVSQISYNPNANSCGFNRASWMSETAFYGSVATDLMQPYNTSSFEVLGDLNESKLDINRETFVIGKWVVKKEIPLIHISGNLKNNPLAVSQRYEALDKAINEYPKHADVLKLIDNFLCSEFTKEVRNDERWRYKISAAYADFVKQDNWPGLIYPSLKAAGAGYNIVLFPEMVDEYLSFEHAALSTFYKRGISTGNEFTMSAYSDNGILRWKDDYTNRLTPNMKLWYRGLSDDNSFQKYIEVVKL